MHTVQQRLLRILSAGPHGVRYFCASPDLGQRLCEDVARKHIDALTELGYVRRHQSVWAITPEGKQFLRAQGEEAGSVLFNNGSTGSNYVPPRWEVARGAEAQAFLSWPSKSF
jgi:hypothetical protein